MKIRHVARSLAVGMLVAGSVVATQAGARARATNAASAYRCAAGRYAVTPPSGWLSAPSSSTGCSKSHSQSPTFLSRDLKAGIVVIDGLTDRAASGSALETAARLGFARSGTAQGTPTVTHRTVNGVAFAVVSGAVRSGGKVYRKEIAVAGIGKLLLIYYGQVESARNPALSREAAQIDATLNTVRFATP